MPPSLFWVTIYTIDGRDAYSLSCTINSTFKLNVSFLLLNCYPKFKNTLFMQSRGQCTRADVSGKSPEGDVHVQMSLANPQRAMYTCRCLWQIPRRRCTYADTSGKSPEGDVHVQIPLANPQRVMYTCRCARIAQKGDF